MKKLHIRKVSLLAASAMLMLSGMCPAVSSKITRHQTAAQLLKGETENTIIDSEGTIKLAREAKEINFGRLLKDVWIINTVISDSAGAIYLGTSPNGGIIKYRSSGRPPRRMNRPTPMLKNPRSLLPTSTSSQWQSIRKVGC